MDSIIPLCAIRCTLEGDFDGCGIFDIRCQCHTPAAVQDISDCIRDECPRREFSQWRNDFKDICELVGVDPTLPTTESSATAGATPSGNTPTGSLTQSQTKTSSNVPPIVTNNPTHQTATRSTTSSRATSTSADSEATVKSSNRSNMTGAIVGAVFGILLLAAFCIFCGLAYRRRLHRRQATSVDLFAPPPPPKDEPRPMNWNPFAPSDAGIYSDSGSHYGGRTTSETTYSQNYAVAHPYVVPSVPPSVAGAGFAGIGAGAGHRTKSEDVAPLPVSRLPEPEVSELPYTRSDHLAQNLPPSAFPASASATSLRRTGSASSSRSTRSGRLANFFSSGPKRRLSSSLSPEQLQHVQNLAASGVPGAAVVDALEAMLRDNYRARTGVNPSDERLPGYAIREQ